VDAGYRINHHVYLGGWFQYAFATISGDVCTRGFGNASCSSSGSDLRFGVTLRYNFKPDARVDPWIAVGAGYEIFNFSATSGTSTQDVTVRGFEYLNMQLGGDFRILPDVAIGPLVMMSFGQYGSYDSTQPNQTQSGDFTKGGLHEWLFFGLRGEYDNL
jgi:hypothetical protein